MLTPATCWYFVLAFVPPLAECCAVMNTPIAFRRRIGPDPHAAGAATYALVGCPDLWELETGDFAVIGSDTLHDRIFLKDSSIEGQKAPGALKRSLSLKKGSSGVIERHHSSVLKFHI